MLLAKRFVAYQSQVERALEGCLPRATTSPEVLHEAMRYSVLGEGKRIRPILVYATGEVLGGALDSLDTTACAIELVHAYSLIHDDLPSMDNDDLRRGRPTCHKVYGEAMAILAGDALLTLAFYVLAKDKQIIVSAEQRLQMIELLAYASGSQAMAGGQAMDLSAIGKQLSIEALEDIHAHKTGALIRASVELGALSVPGLNAQQFQRLSAYGRCIGLAFQIKDDILDVECDTDTLGKPQGSDSLQDKPSYPDLLGLEEAKKVAVGLHEQALVHLNCFDTRADVLREIADYVIFRGR